MNDCTPVVDELIDVLDRFSQSSDDAICACAVPDAAAIESALEIRQVALNRARELLPMLPNNLPAAVRTRLTNMVEADRDLYAVLSQAVERIREQVSQIAAHASRVDGYAAAAPRMRRLDTVR